MLLMLSRIAPSSFSKVFIYFLLRLSLATLWKNLELQSPSFTYITLDFCLQCTSSLNSSFPNSPFKMVLLSESFDERFPSCFKASVLAILVRMFFFLSFNSPKVTLFHSVNLDLTNCNFLINLCPSHPSH